jgi:hypothetical protein
VAARICICTTRDAVDQVKSAVLSVMNPKILVRRVSPVESLVRLRISIEPWLESRMGDVSALRCTLDDEGVESLH